MRPTSRSRIATRDATKRGVRDHGAKSSQVRGSCVGKRCEQRINAHRHDLPADHRGVYVVCTAADARASAFVRVKCMACSLERCDASNWNMILSEPLSMVISSNYAHSGHRDSNMMRECRWLKGRRRRHRSCAAAAAAASHTIIPQHRRRRLAEASTAAAAEQH